MALSVIEYAYKSAGDRRLVVFNFLWPWFGKKIPCQVDNPNIILLIISLIDMLLWGESMHKIRHYIIDSHCIPIKPQIVIGLSQLHPIVSIIIISQWSVYHKKTYIYIPAYPKYISFYPSSLSECIPIIWGWLKRWIFSLLKVHFGGRHNFQTHPYVKIGSPNSWKVTTQT